MSQTIDECRDQTLRAAPSPDAILLRPDVWASLSVVSGNAWDVEREVDPSGDVSIIVLPACDDPAMPTFILYEADGLARVATIRRDVWESDQAFPSCPRAVAAIIAATTALAMAA